MRCPFCGHSEDKVVDSRESREGEAIRRRRECLSCARRFTSYERVEEVPIFIVKKDGRREPFDRQKLLRGIMAACQKRPVSLTSLEELVGDIQARLVDLSDREIASRTLGEMVMDGLKVVDSVAYVRFASVYRDFKDLPDFVKALESLVGTVKQTGAEAFARTNQPKGPPPLQTGPILVKAPITMPAATPLFPGEDVQALPVPRRRKAK
jgi:transcriptional repressor NrdR